MQKRSKDMQDTSGVHVWLVLAKAIRTLAVHAEESLNLSRTGLGDSDFRVLEVLLHKGPVPVNTIGPKVWLTPGSISVAVDRLEKKALVKGRALIHQDLSRSRGRNGRGRQRPVERGAADLAAAT